MPKKQSTKKRTQVKDLPHKTKKLTAEALKKVKGGHDTMPLEEISLNYGKISGRSGRK